MIDTDKYEGHTEGPWEWDDLHSTGEEKLFVHKKSDDNNLIAEVSGKINGKSECANARLIADAPLLLAEVKRLRERLEVIEDFINDELRAFVNSNTFDHIYDAIEKKLEVIE